jgi:lipopolysaccharide transport system permease protein
MSIELCEPEAVVRTATEKTLSVPTAVVAGRTVRRRLDVAGIAELWRYRELVYFFAWRDFKVRYKQAALGATWAIFQPLANMIVFTLFFGRLANIPSDGLPYPIFAYSGLLLWTYCSVVVAQAGQSLVANANLVTKVYFPKVALPFASAASAIVDLAIGMVLLVLMMAYYDLPLGLPLLLAPVFLVALVVLTAGISLLLAALNVWYRDLKHALPLLIQLWLFVTPVIYPISFIPERYQWLMAFNPLAGLVEGFRACVLQGIWPQPLLSVTSLATTAIIFILGLRYFRRAERRFADVI